MNIDVDTDATFPRLTNRIGERTGRLQSHRGMRAGRVLPTHLAQILQWGLVAVAAAERHLECPRAYPSGVGDLADLMGSLQWRLRPRLPSASVAPCSGDERSCRAM